MKKIKSLKYVKIIQKSLFNNLAIFLIKESGKTLNQASMHSSPQHDMIQLLKHKLQTVQNNYDTLMRERDELKEVSYIILLTPILTLNLLWYQI